MKVACVQMAVVEGDKAATIEKACDGIRRCRGADLIVLPEIWNIGFMSFDRYHDEAEDPEGPTFTAMRAMAREMKAYVHTAQVKAARDHFPGLAGRVAWLNAPL